MRKHDLKHFYILTVASLSLLLSTARAGEIEATASIIFRGTSTLHAFEGTVATAPFTATFSEDKETGQLRISATATVTVADMTTHNGKRDKNMFKMLDSEKYSLITGVLANALLPVKGSGEAMLHLKIHGVEQDVAATLSDVKRNGDQASCLMTFPVSLAAFNLKAPTVMGLIRVGDTVIVECTLKGTTK